MTPTDLGKKMIARADKDRLAEDHPMRVRAKEFDEAVPKYMGNPQTMGVAAFMGFWARARRAWCDYTGERLL